MAADYKPKPWLAGLLSVVMPGLGHIYAGNPAAALGWVLTCTLVGITALLVMLLPFSRANLIAAVLMMVAAYFVVTRSAVALALERDRASTRRRWFQRWYVILALFVAVGFVVQPLLLFGIKRSLAESLVSTSAAMAPAILEGDYFLVRKPFVKKERGTVVVFSWPEPGSGRFLMRIVAQPLDTIATRNGVLFVNGNPERNADGSSPILEDVPVEAMDWQRDFYSGAAKDVYKPTLNNWGPLIVPAGHFFLLGDNRNESLDSRFRGFVPVEQLVAQARTIYFSRDPVAGAIRWSRIGTVVR